MLTQIKLILFVYLLNYFAYAQNVTYARKYFDKVKSADQIDSIVSILNKDTSPTVNAYKGAYIMMKAEYVTSPLKKYNCFIEGKEFVENSVLSDSTNIEIRHIRAIVQANLPKFLFYYENIQPDLKYILKHISQSELNYEVKLYIINNLTAANLISEQQINLLKNTKNNE